MKVQDADFLTPESLQRLLEHLSQFGRRMPTRLHGVDSFEIKTISNYRDAIRSGVYFVSIVQSFKSSLDRYWSMNELGYSTLPCLGC